MKTGSATSASAGTSTVNTRGAAAQARALTRSVGTKPLRPRSEAAVATASAPDALGRLDLDLEVVAGQRRLVVQAAEALERGEPPDLLAPGRDGVVGQVEGAHRVQVG